MFDNSIRGGQVFIHQMRMFKQVARSAFVLSWIFGFVGAAYLNIDGFAHIDMHAAVRHESANRPVEVINHSGSIAQCT